MAKSMGPISVKIRKRINSTPNLFLYEITELEPLALECDQLARENDPSAQEVLCTHVSVYAQRLGFEPRQRGQVLAEIKKVLSRKA